MDASVVLSMNGDTSVVSVSGEIDLESAPLLGDALTTAVDAGCRRIVVDMAEVTFMDSSGLGTLVQARNRVFPNGGSVSLVSLPRGVLRVIELTGLAQVFSLYATVSDAIDSVPTP